MSYTTPFAALSHAAAIALTVFLAGCGIKPDIDESLPTQTVPEREAVLNKFTPWRALGSIAIDSKEQGKFNASFAWDVNRKGFDIKLFGPLGVQVVHLSQDKKGAQITDRSGTADGDSAEQLLLEVLGTEVPISKMQKWAVGLPGDATELARDEIGRLDSMTVVENADANWQVDFKRYTVLENMYLPKTVDVEGDGVSIKLSFKKWSRGDTVDDGRLSIPGVGS